VQHARAPVTADEAKHFADQLFRALEAQDLQQVERLLPTKQLLERVARDLEMTTDEREAYVSAAQARLGQGWFGRQILAATVDGGSYKFLRVRVIEDRPRAFFRMLSADGAVTYHDYALARLPDGVRMEDVFVFPAAQWISEELRRMAIPMLTRVRQGRFIKGPDDPVARNARTQREMAQALEQGAVAKAVALYRELPEELQNDKAILMAYTQALARQGEAGAKDYGAAFEKLRKLYPNEPSTDFISYSYYALKKEYDQALLAVERFERAIGGDPYVASVRGNFLVELKRFDEARRVAETAVKAEPHLAYPYFTRIFLSVRERNYAETLEWLKNVVQQCEVLMDDLATAPEYAEFVRSPQYREWQQWYAARGKK
jgi:hypothetical protein